MTMVIDNVKEMTDLIKRAGDIELYRKAVHLESQIIELIRQLHSAEERVKELESTLAFSGKLTFKPPFYFSEGDPVPYCQRCWEVDKRAVHMTRTNRVGGLYHCAECKFAAADKTKAMRP